MRTTCLILAMTPTNVLAALCAIEARLAGRLDALDATLVLHYPGGSDGMTDEVARVLKEITGPFPYVRRMVSLPQSRYDALSRTSGAILPSPSAIREALGLERLDYWIYAHDVSGTIVPAVDAAYPRARMICCGDALGQVFQTDVHLGYLVPDRPRSTRTSMSRWEALSWRIRRWWGREPRPRVGGSLVPDEAVLVMPVDQSGQFLPHIPLTVVDREVARSVLRRASSAPALTAFVHQVGATYASERRVLLLTENWAEGGSIELDREVELCASLVEQTCEPGSVILIKSHPGEVLPRVAKLTERLSGTHCVVGLDPAFRRYPVELWLPLVKESRVISTMYPALSLKYLYDVDVIQPMDDAFIERWFPPWTWASYKNAVALNMIPLRRLAGWDGHSPLFSGPAT